MFSICISFLECTHSYSPCHEKNVHLWHQLTNIQFQFVWGSCFIRNYSHELRMNSQNIHWTFLVALWVWTLKRSKFHADWINLFNLKLTCVEISILLQLAFLFVVCNDLLYQKKKKCLLFFFFRKQDAKNILRERKIGLCIQTRDCGVL